MAPPPMPCSPNRMTAQPHNRGTGVGEYETEREAAMPARQKTPDGAEPLIIQEGGEPTRACTHKIAIGDSDLINVRFAPLCGLKSELPRGPRSARNRHRVHFRAYRRTV
jgi:hypothetical protein